MPKIAEIEPTPNPNAMKFVLPAVAAALEAFDGVRRYTLPMKDSPAARAMSVGRIRRPRSRG